MNTFILQNWRLFVNVLSYFSCPPALLPPGDLSQAPKREAGAPGGAAAGARCAPKGGGRGLWPLSPPFVWLANGQPNAAAPPRASQRPPCRHGSRLHDAPFRLPFPGCQERCCSVCAGGGGVLQGRAKGPPPVKPKQGPKAPVLWALCAPAAPRRNAPRPANHTASRPKNGRLASICLTK